MHCAARASLGRASIPALAAQDCFWNEEGAFTGEISATMIKEAGAAYVIVTGHSDVEGAIAALRLGAADYLLKPINPDALRIRLGRLMEQRRLERAQQRSEALSRQLVEAAECMIVMLRSDLSIAYFSPHAEQLTGYAADEVVGRSFLTLFVPEGDREGVVTRYEKVRAGSSVRGIEGQVVCRDGSLRWVLKNARALSDYDGSPAILVVYHDITELKLAQDRALQSERLATIGHMCTGLAHESGNALQRIQACLEMLTLKVEDRSDAINRIERIQCAQDDLRHLFDDVKGYAAPIKLERRECDLAAVWRESWAQLDNVRRDRKTDLRERIDGLDLHCGADPFRIGQVFRNIFDNALAASSTSVEIEVRATEARLEGRPAIRISVTDNGPGLSPEQRRRIFESFYTTKTKGTGLGMAIAKRIAEAHGGRIAVGEGGPGAEIILTLPRGSP